MNSHSLIFTITFSFISLLGSELLLEPHQNNNSYEFRYAQLSDVPGLVELINKQAQKDSDKIVVVPERFREGYVRSAINQSRLFVALHAGAIIGYKKLFCVTDKAESEDILKNELRAIGTQSVSSGSIDPLLRAVSMIEPKQLPAELLDKSTVIYTGADFTHPNYRGKGVNTLLSEYAFNQLAPSVRAECDRRNSDYSVLVYGLTRYNAGEEHELLGGRTCSIVKQFLAFRSKINPLNNSAGKDALEIHRFTAFKPSFDPHAIECVPLADDQAVPGYGYVLLAATSGNNH